MVFAGTALVGDQGQKNVSATMTDGVITAVMADARARAGHRTIVRALHCTSHSCTARLPPRHP